MRILNKFIALVLGILIPLQSGVFAFISLYFRSGSSRSGIGN
jgi:hypothetical protein